MDRQKVYSTVSNNASLPRDCHSTVHWTTQRLRYATVLALLSVYEDGGNGNGNSLNRMGPLTVSSDGFGIGFPF